MGERIDIASIAITALRAMEATKLAELQQLRITINSLERARKVDTQHKLVAVRAQPRPDYQLEMQSSQRDNHQIETQSSQPNDRIGLILSKLSPLMSGERRDRITKIIHVIDLLSELRMPCNSRTIDERINVGCQIVINDLQLLRAAGILFQEGYGRGIRWKVAA